MGDGKRITQCLMNLAGNALKFTREGRVEIRVELQGEHLLFAVADTGIGIPADQIDNIFEEFRQADATVSRDFGGTGLGLSHHQEARRAARRADLGGERAGQGLDVLLLDPGAGGEGGGRVKTILYVEDNEFNRKIVRHLLGRTSYRLIEAGDGEAGVATARESGPGPDHHGHPAPQAVRARGHPPAPRRPGDRAAFPIIVITSFALAGDEEKAREAGAAAYLAKPYSPRELLQMIRQLAPES